MKKRTILLLAAALSALMTGCSGSTNETSETTASETVSAASGEKLQYWCELTTTVSANYSNLGDTPFGKGLQEKTGVEIEFLHPPTGQLKEQFSLILADGNLPDLMEYHWISDYPGGPEKAIKDGVIIPLNDVFDQYCPNITKYLKENPEIDRMIKTDDGHYYVFPFIRGDAKLMNTIGLMVRKDWLDELNMEVPTTMDEWHDVLTAFKNEKGCTAPYSFEYTNGQFLGADPFVAAFETNRSFYLGSDKTIHFGAVEPGFKEYLTMMNQWYMEGLIDPDLATLKNDQVSAKITNGQAGASMGQSGSRMGTWTAAARGTTPEFTLVPAPVPTLEKGKTAEMGHIENPFSGRSSVAITTSCKDIERAAKLMDWAYGEEGHLYYNFGTEGTSYTMVDGYPTYTDEILKNPDGLPVSQAMSAYIRGNYNGPFVQDVRYLEQYYTLEEQSQAPIVWDACNGAAHTVPPITPTADESKEFSTIMNEINTYRDEMILKFIFGTESLENFDTYVKNIENMGLERALEIQNAALARYNAR
ncbi:MAG: extracellular solute-binding protein [Lachnospiraceae bacterium]|jgi:putative aldouronate transport system substrate-binding protein|nr:extracellular solute-binding protein [Lachnospiraceae bacterium]